MSQPRIVRTVGRSFEPMAFVVAVRGDLATSRSTDARAAQPGRISDRSTRSPNARTMGGARSTPLEDARRVKNACNLHRSTGRLGHRPCGHVAEPGGACKWRSHRQGRQPQSGGRSGVLAPLLPPTLVVAAPLASPLVVTITAQWAGPSTARSVRLIRLPRARHARARR